MEYIKIDWNDRHRGYDLNPNAYLDLLADHTLQLPPGASAFARDPAHYDFTSGRCVKDLILDGISMPLDNERASAEIRFLPNPFKHAEGLRLTYHGVWEFSMERHGLLPESAGRDSLLLDELLPQEEGCRHELQTRELSIVIACTDVTAQWITDPA
jgi:hypothetical protein